MVGQARIVRVGEGLRTLPPGTDRAGVVAVSMDDDQLRVAIYRTFATTGRAPTIEDLVSSQQVSAPEVTTALRRLAAGRHLVLGDDDAIVLAHPFSAIPMGFAAMGRTTLWWGGCAWDAFALPHLLPDEPSVLVATTCPSCAAALAWNVDRHAPPRGPACAHFLVPVERMWSDVVHTCRNQRLFCTEACVEAWLARTASPRGAVLDLDTLWRLASHWYDGRLDAGYARREPAKAKAYFRGVGLSGSFWGL